MSEQIWLIWAGEGSKYVDEFISRSVTAMGWGDTGDFNFVGSLDQAKQEVTKTFSEYSNAQVTAIATQIFNFRKQVTKGDLVLMPDKSKNKIHIGRVDGNYEYQTNIISREYSHVRHVKWFKSARNAEFGENIRKSMQAPRALSNLTKYHAEIFDILQRQPLERLISLRYEGFKAFNKFWEVPILPITIISGTNSSGKTTILQGLLLARQTLISISQSLLDKENALVFNGSLVPFKYFNEMVFGKPDIPYGFKLGFGVRIRVDSEKVKKHFEINNDEGDDTVLIQLDVSFNFDEVRNIVLAKEISLIGILSNHNIKLRIEPDGSQWNLELQTPSKNRFSSATNLTLNRFIPVWQLRGRPSASELQRREIYDVFIDIFSPALDILREELSEHIYYIEPLRSRPRRPYLRENITGLSLGEGGVATIQQLFDNWSQPVDFVNLPEDISKFSKSQI